MTPKDKAKELIDKFLNHTSHPLEEGSYNWYHAKKCALICVDEVTQTVKRTSNKNVDHYWNKVKKEIEKWN